MYSVTFSSNIPRFGYTDFEVLFIQSLKPITEDLINRFKTIGTAEEISYTSSIKIYEGKLTNKSIPIYEFPCKLEFEKKFLKKIIEKEIEL